MIQTSVVAAYLTENESYISEESALALSSIADADWPAILAALDVLNEGCTEPGVDCSVTATAETLADFDEERKNWSEPGLRTAHEVAGRQAVHYDRFQRKTGTPRQSMVVVDLGDRRIALY